MPPTQGFKSTDEVERSVKKAKICNNAGLNFTIQGLRNILSM